MTYFFKALETLEINILDTILTVANAHSSS